MTKITFQTEKCSRCGGTGRMPFAAYGGVCFKCNGHANVYTRAGLAARTAFLKARAEGCPKVRAASLKAGQRFSTDDGTTWRTVVEDVDPSHTAGSVNGVPLISVHTQRVDYLSTADNEVTLWSSEAHRAAIQKVAKRKGVVAITEEEGAIQ